LRRITVNSCFPGGLNGRSKTSGNRPNVPIWQCD
jgi:hypothetical protein